MHIHVSRLERLPLEIFQNITSQLDSRSVGHLRLASKLMNKYALPRFLHYVDGVQTIDLNLSGLARLDVLSTSPDLKSVVHTLRLICPFYHDTSAQPQGVKISPDPPGVVTIGEPREPVYPLKTQKDRCWLNDRVAEQVNLMGDDICEQLTRALREIGSLEELSLETIVILGPYHRVPLEQVWGLPWRAVWSRAIQAFRILLSGIARSQIHLASLVIFQDTKICSVPLEQLAATIAKVKEEGFPMMAMGLKKFSISISTPLGPEVSPLLSQTDYYKPIDTSHSPAADVAIGPYSEAMADLLRMMPKVENLHIHFYRLLKPYVMRRPGEPMAAEDQPDFSTLFEHLFGSEHLPALQTLSLSGATLSTAVLSRLPLTCPKLSLLRLHYVHLNENLWRPVLVRLLSGHIKTLCIMALTDRAVHPGLPYPVDSDRTRVAGQILQASYPNSNFIHQTRGFEWNTGGLAEPVGPEVCIVVNTDCGLNNGIASAMSAFHGWKRWLECGPPP